MLKKLGLMLFLLAVFLLNAKSANAYYEQGTGGGVGGSAPIMGSWENAVYGKRDEFNLQSSTNETFKNLVVSATQAIIGPENPEYQTMAGHGAIASVGNLIAGMYSNPPASSVTYFADVLHNLGLAKPVYAQGVGFSGMSNLLPLWKASRNLAYILFIVAFLYIGLAIMFRVKISPQAIVTIQSALPKLIIALILVTFSYAIVGLMIDLIYVLINLGVLAFFQTSLVERTLEGEQAFYANLGFSDILGLILGGTGRAFPLVTIVSTLVLAVATYATSGLILLILSVLILFMVFKLFLSLLICYAQIILALIFGPIQIVLSTFPGKKEEGVGTWFNNLLANILVFPAVALFIMIAWYLTGTVKLKGPVWTPPVLGVPGEGLTALIGIAMLYMASKIPDAVKAAFKIKPQEFGPISWLSKSVEGGAQKRLGDYVVSGEVGRDVKDKFITPISDWAKSRGGPPYSHPTIT